MSLTTVFLKPNSMEYVKVYEDLGVLKEILTLYL